MSAGQWVTLKADSYEAQVSAATLSAYPGSLLAHLVEMELANPSGPLHTPCIRLDCCEAVGREIVSLLRYMGSYTPPTDAKLLRALQHQLDFYGIPMPSDIRGQEIVLVPACRSEDVDDSAQFGMFVYSSRARGWATITGQADTRPDVIRNNTVSCVASVLRAESTSAGEDLACVVSNDEENNSTAFMINSSLKCKQISHPPVHTCAYNSAMAAARGNLYLLGGLQHDQWEGPAINIPFEVYDPHLNTWHQATPPAHGGCVHGHALVATQPEGMLVAVGGYWSGHHSATAIRDHVLAYDVSGGKWSSNPSGCTYSGAADAAVCAAAACVDSYTVMVLGASPDARTARVDLLDMRMWRWRSGAALAGGYTHGIGLVTYDSQVLAVGGRDTYAADNPYIPPDCTNQVRAYDVRSDQWRDLPQLPHLAVYEMGVYDACPVVMRAASVLQT